MFKSNNFITNYPLAGKQFSDTVQAHKLVDRELQEPLFDVFLWGVWFKLETAVTRKCKYPGIWYWNAQIPGYRVQVMGILKFLSC